MPGIETLAPALTGGVLVILFIAFLFEWRPPEVSALAAVAVLMVAGVLTIEDVLGVLTNSAPITIASLFILSAALVRTGVLDLVTRSAVDKVARLGWLAPPIFFLILIAASAFLNNTPVVMLAIPVAITLSTRLGETPSRMLIPVSYAAIVGGTVTLIGTSTNIIVDGVARQEGLRPFTIFEIAPLGLAVAAAGLVMLGLFRWLLPARTSMADLTAANQQAKFLVEMAVPEGSQLVGRPPSEVSSNGDSDRRLIDVVRAGQSLRADISAVTIEAGDVLVFRTSVGDVMTMKEQGHVATAPAPSTVAPIGSRAAIMVEALVGPGSGLLDKSLDELRLRRRYGVYPVAIHRRGANLAERLRTTPIQVGDTMLLEGAPDDLRRLVDQEGLISVAAPRWLGFRLDRAPIAILGMLGVIVGASFGLMPIAGLAVIGAALVLATRCVEPQEAFDSIDWRTLTLIVAMLAIGVALDKTGLVQMIVNAVAPWLSTVPPIVALVLVYVLGGVLTEAVTNNAVAIVMTSIVIALAGQLGLDPRPFVVAVMFAASASFLTPIGYQTNTLVYGPGGYRFTDYLWLGLPLALVVGVVTVLLIPVFWPLQPAG